MVDESQPERGQRCIAEAFLDWDGRAWKGLQGYCLGGISRYSGKELVILVEKRSGIWVMMLMMRKYDRSFLIGSGKSIPSGEIACR